jgi:hypothetical protein
VNEETMTHWGWGRDWCAKKKERKKNILSPSYNETVHEKLNQN